MLVGAHHDVGPPTGPRHEVGVGLVRRQGPAARELERLAVCDVPFHQALDPGDRISLHEPDLVEQGPHRCPARLVVQQVVALRDDQSVRRPDGDRAGDRELATAVERRGVDGAVGLRAHPAQQCDVPGDVERLGRALSLAECEPGELVVVEVEAVHRYDDRIVTDPGGQPLGQGRLAGTGGTADAENSAAGGHQRPGPLHQGLVERNRLGHGTSVTRTPPRLRTGAPD